MSEAVFPPEQSDTQVIEANKNVLEAPVDSVELRVGESLVDVRLRGAYITDGRLTSPSTGEVVSLFYSDAQIWHPKISATHAMVPYGNNGDLPSGQHGFPRWVDYDQVSYGKHQENTQQVILEAQQGERGISLLRAIELAPDSIMIKNTIHNTGTEKQHTSIGEHAYFNLTYGDFEELLIDEQGIDELLGEGSKKTLANDGTLYCEMPEEGVVVQFPDGHKAHIAAEFVGETVHPVALLIWQRQGTESICFEPVVGVSKEGANDGVVLLPQASASLCTTVTLL